MSFTFEVHKVKRQNQPLGVIPAAKWWETKSKPKPEACSDGAYVNSPINPLVGAIGTAYNEHRPLSLSPDAVWLTITQGLALHIEANTEALRGQFVQHDGKKYLEIRRDGFTKGSPTNDWPGAFSEFSDKITDHIGKKRELIVSDFSTTTPVSRAASEIVLMDAMRSYFSYGMRTLCGFPSVTLEGEVSDWESIWLRAGYLAELGLIWWLDHLLPVLEKLVMTAKGNPDLGFWGRAYKADGGSGGPYISGWVNTFFPYLGGGKSSSLDWTKTRFMNGVGPDTYPGGLSKAPLLWHYFSETYTMNLIGGLVGVEQDADGTLRPGIGWAVADDPEAQGDHECEVDQPYDSQFCKHCGRILSGVQVRAQREKFDKKILADYDAKHGPPKDERDTYNRREALANARYGRCRDEPSPGEPPPVSVLADEP